jgi:hypothetical protein
MKNRIAFILIFVLLLKGNIFAEQFRPNSKYYFNPYSLIYEDNVKTYKGYDWIVYANKNKAEIFSSTNQVSQTASYLEAFKVIEKNGNKIKVVSRINPQKTGWMKLIDVIPIPAPIKNNIGVYQKVFLKVKVNEALNTREGMDGLRFRNGPGSGENSYDYLIGRDEVNRVSTLFFYVYGVAFNTNGETEAELEEKYADINHFRSADYYLMGDRLSFGEKEVKTVIRGWIPRETAILWESRQALEAIEETGKNEAHKFMNQSDLITYFTLPETEKADYLSRLFDQNKVEIDYGDSKPQLGQTLRYLVFDQSNRPVRSAFVGVTGSETAGKIKYVDSNRDDVLKEYMLGSRYVDIFFLIDATASMETPLSSAAEVAQKIVNEFKNDPELKIDVRAAVYRDLVDNFRSYVEWDDDEYPNISDWLKSIKAKSVPGDDYKESLFHGISNAIDGWDSSHKYSNKLMFILGDAGDNLKGTISSVDELAGIMRSKMITPFPVLFNHKLRYADPDNLGAICDQRSLSGMGTHYNNSKERKAMCAFLSQMSQLNNLVYGSIDQSLNNVPIVKGKQFESSLNKKTDEMIKKSRQKIDAVVKVRQGQQSVSETGNGLFAAQIRMLSDIHPELSHILRKKPEMGFYKVHVAVKSNKRLITRPVLFLGEAEILKIQRNIQTLKAEHRDCNPEVMDKILKESVSALLGDLLQINPKQIDDEQLKKWFRISIGSERSFVAAPKVVETMCKNPKVWNKFLNKIEKADAFLGKLIAQANDKTMKSRLYVDIKGVKYYWIYPEEIYPAAKIGN